jgi:hypothetical protein
MNREIGKYRGKRKDNGEWAYGYLVFVDEKFFIIEHGCYTSTYRRWDIALSYDYFIEIDPETVGEPIGLHDKNSKRELYDGDRVVIGSDRGILVWDEFDLCWSLQLDNNEGDLQAICRFYTSEEIENIEYIGNIHEEVKP